MAGKGPNNSSESAPVARLRELVEQSVQRSLAAQTVEPGLVVGRRIRVTQSQGKVDLQAIAEQTAREVSAEFKGLNAEPFVAHTKQEGDAERLSPGDIIDVIIGLILGRRT
jgi:hypothetical protein